MTQVIPAGLTFYLDSAEEWQGFEFLYLLTGKITYLGANPPIALEPGDYIVRHLVPERSWFKAEEDTVLLYVSSRPAFQVMREEIEEFLKIARQIEADEYTEGHSRRLERLASAVGERLGLSPERLANLTYAALFHDVGKAKVPKEILQKPEKLSPEEWEIMKKHTTWGRELLEQKPFLKEAARIVEQTHERVDGTGYPKGLSGDEIALEAKIVAVVDAYDAMTTDRPYRKALPRERAIAELKRQAGTQFDPKVVEAFLQVLSEWERTPEPVWFNEEMARLRQREAFLRITESILRGKDVSTILKQVVQGITQHTPFRQVTLILYDRPVPPESVEEAEVAEIVTSSSPSASAAEPRDLLPPPEKLKDMLRDEFRLGKSYYIHRGRLPKELGPERIPAPPGGDTWHPDDLLIVPLWVEEGQLIGYLSLKDPVDGRAPTAEGLAPVEMFASLAALGVLEVRRREELKRALEDLRQLAVRDPLTGLYNRRFLEELLDKEIASAKRHGYPIALAMLDLRGFHEVNNRFGHLVGDRVLKEVAELFSDTVRRSDTVIRYGGDEFLVVMPRTGYAEAKTVTARIRRRLKEKDFGLPLRLSVRTGIAVWTPEEERDIEELLAEADAWMYHHRGRTHRR